MSDQVDNLSNHTEKICDMEGMSRGKMSEGNVWGGGMSGGGGMWGSRKSILR